MPSSSSSSSSGSQTHHARTSPLVPKMDKMSTNLQPNVPNSNRNTRLNVSNPYAPHKDVLSSTGAACNLWGPVAPEECNTHLKREAVHSRPRPHEQTTQTNLSGMWLKVSAVCTWIKFNISLSLKTHTHTHRVWLLANCLAPAQPLKVNMLTVSISSSLCRFVHSGKC